MNIPTGFSACPENRPGGGGKKPKDGEQIFRYPVEVCDLSRCLRHRYRMDKCLFCDSELSPGSEEHVFLSALGGRIATYRATCLACNNAFANNETGKVDDALAEGFKEVRNGLRIWSGRKQPPPTLLKAGSLENGAEFDLAPGFLPVVRSGRLPGSFTTGSQYNLVARDEDDARRLLDILSKRGISAKIGAITRVKQKVSLVRLCFHFDGTKVWRSVAKTAVVCFVVLYGNEQARRFISTDLRRAIRYGEPPINNFAGWDFTNDWPRVVSLDPHSRTPDAKTSGFEHSVVIADVGQRSVAYVTLFGGWRLSIDLGPKTNLPVRGLATNPRPPKAARFIVAAESPIAYSTKHPGSFAAEHDQVLDGNNAALKRAMQVWNEEARRSYAEDLAAELAASLEATGSDEGKRAAEIESFASKLAAIEFGDGWSTDLGTLFNEDEATRDSTE